MTKILNIPRSPVAHERALESPLQARSRPTTCAFLSSLPSGGDTIHGRLRPRSAARLVGGDRVSAHRNADTVPGVTQAPVNRGRGPPEEPNCLRRAQVRDAPIPNALRMRGKAGGAVYLVCIYILICTVPRLTG